MIGGPADEDDVMDHPYICFRFLAVPPIKTAYISSGFGPIEEAYECIQNELGVTVQDAFTSLVDEYVLDACALVLLTNVSSV
jgi:hypothetical protein